jgi:hypothetical protein
MLKIKHVPEQLFDMAAFPIIMTLMLTYLFGGALAGSTGEYPQFFLPGIMVTSVIMITMYTGVGLNTDIEKGFLGGSGSTNTVSLLTVTGGAVDGRRSYDPAAPQHTAATVRLLVAGPSADRRVALSASSVNRGPLRPSWR